MKNLKKLIFSIFVVGFLFAGFSVFAQESNIDFFYSPTCPHCAKEEKFLDEIEGENPDITINRYSVNQKANVDMMKEFYSDYDVPTSYHGMVPITFIGDKYFVGFNEDLVVFK